jgi:hypothetical protein
VLTADPVLDHLTDADEEGQDQREDEGSARTHSPLQQSTVILISLQDLLGYCDQFLAVTIGRSDDHLVSVLRFLDQTDKASMLDEAIDYLKSLQLRVQMMWTTGGGMPAPAPAMFPASGAHRYMQRMASMRSRMPPFRTNVYSNSNGTKS